MKETQIWSKHFLNPDDYENEIFGLSRQLSVVDAKALNSKRVHTSTTKKKKLFCRKIKIDRKKKKKKKCST